MVACLAFMEAMSRGLTASVGNVRYGTVSLFDSFVSIWMGSNFIMQHDDMFVMIAVLLLRSKFVTFDKATLS